MRKFNTANPIGLPSGYISPYNIGRVRHGKTERDHRSGAWRQRLDNRAARAQLVLGTPWYKQLPAKM